MKRDVREFLEKEEVGAARSKAVKRAKKNKWKRWFTEYLEEKAEKLEASGNPAAAAEFRKRWTRFGVAGGAPTQEGE